MTLIAEETIDKLNLLKILNFYVSTDNQENEKKIHRIRKNSYKSYFSKVSRTYLYL